MNLKNELKKFSKSIVDSTNIIINTVNIDSISESLKNTQTKFSNKLKEYSKELDDIIEQELKNNNQENNNQENKNTTNKEDVFTEKEDMTIDLDISIIVKQSLVEAGLDTVNKIKDKSDEELLLLKGIGKKSLEKLRKVIDK